MIAPRKEAWTSNMGVILAVAGSAVGLGNFIRFPGLAAQYGGGGFMIAYFLSFLIIGIPLCMTEWAIGRHGGRLGFHSGAGILHAIVRRPWAKYLGGLGVLIVTFLYTYYVYIEAWCLGYAVNAAAGNLSGAEFAAGAFFDRFTGADGNGSAMRFGLQDVGLFLLVAFALNFFFIFRGVSRGIEWVCRYALPLLVVLALIILVRVLTLGAPVDPERDVLAGLGYLWNPGDIGKDLRNPQLWLAAAGQVFFSLSIGMGVIVTYASYLARDADIALSGLTAAAANETCEVGLGGLITVTAAYVFLGATAITASTVGLGFVVLPEVFTLMPGGRVFATLYFGLLFLAAVTSSLSMLQPGIALLEEGLGLTRDASVAALALCTGAGALFVWYFSADLKALATLDFWVGTFLIYVQATLFVLVFGWVVGIRAGLTEIRRGARIHVPDALGVLVKYICPLYLGVIFMLFILGNVLGWNFSIADAQFERKGYVKDLLGPEPNPVAQMSVGLVAVLAVAIGIAIKLSARRWDRRLRDNLNPSSDLS